MTFLRTAKADLTAKQNNFFLCLEKVAALLHILCKVIFHEILEIKMLSVKLVSGMVLSA